jgi:hypothetical protein
MTSWPHRIAPCCHTTPTAGLLLGGRQRESGRFRQGIWQDSVGEGCRFWPTSAGQHEARQICIWQKASGTFFCEGSVLWVCQGYIRVWCQHSPSAAMPGSSQPWVAVLPCHTLQLQATTGTAPLTQTTEICCFQEPCVTFLSNHLTTMHILQAGPARS